MLRKNIRSWLTGINDINNYSTQTADYSETPQYNGNIASLSWRAPLGTCCDIQGHHFPYNALNLPDVFTFTNATLNSKIEIVYKAAGKNWKSRCILGQLYRPTSMPGKDSPIIERLQYKFELLK